MLCRERDEGRPRERSRDRERERSERERSERERSDRDRERSDRDRWVGVRIFVVANRDGWNRWAAVRRSRPGPAMHLAPCHRSVTPMQGTTRLLSIAVLLCRYRERERSSRDNDRDRKRERSRERG